MGDAVETDVTQHAGGMPQLNFETFPNQIFWLAVALVIVFFIVSKVILPRIGGVLEERHGMISGYLAQAADFKQQAEQAKADFEAAQAEARAEAQRIAAEAKAAIQKDLDKAIAKADAEIAAKTAESEKAIAEIRAGAIENVHAVATATAGEIVAALMPSVADDAAVADAVETRMKG